MSAYPLPPSERSAAEGHGICSTWQPCIYETSSPRGFESGTLSSLDLLDDTTGLTLPDNSTTDFDFGSFEQTQETTDEFFGEDGRHEAEPFGGETGDVGQKRPRSLDEPCARLPKSRCDQTTQPGGQSEFPPRKRRKWDQPYQTTMPGGQPEFRSTNHQKLAQAYQIFFSDRLVASFTEQEIQSLTVLSQLNTDDVRRFLKEDHKTIPALPTAAPQNSVHDRILDLVRDHIRHAGLRGCRPGRRTRKNVGELCCTSKCGYRTTRFDDFVRHEEIIQPQEYWCCRQCLAHSPEQHPFITHRKDKFTGHIHKCHGDILPQKGKRGDDEVKRTIDRVRNESRVPYTAPFKSTCGFCGQLQRCWQDRNKHVVGHFKGSIAGGRRHIGEWRDPWTEDDDAEDSDPDDGDDGGNPDSGSSSDDDHLPPDSRNEGSQDPSKLGTDGDVRGSGYSGSSGASGSIGFFQGDSAHGTYGSRPCSSLPYMCTGMQANNSHLRLLSTSVTLGKGTFASVDKLIDDFTKEEFARKKITPVVLGASAKQRFDLEVRIMERLNHPNIVRIKGYWCDRSSMNILMSPAAESNMRTMLSMRCPWMGKQIPETMWWWTWLENLASALAHMHSRNVRHGDIKPSNILVHESDVYFCDFGVSRQVKTKSSSSSEPPMTPLYAAPELFSRTRHGRAADVFSLGCVFLELLTVHRLGTLTGFYAYLRDASKTKRQKLSYQSKLYEVMKWISVLAEHTDTGTAQVLQMCKLMLSPTASERPNASQVHEILRRVLRDSPRSTLSALEPRVRSFGLFKAQKEAANDEGGLRQLWQQCRTNTPANRNPFDLLFPARYNTPGQSLGIYAQLETVVRAEGSDPPKACVWEKDNEGHRSLPVRRLLDCDLLGAGQSTESLLPPYDESALSLSLSPSQQQSAEVSLLRKLFHDSASSGEDPRSRWFRDKSTTYDRVLSPAIGHHSSHDRQSYPRTEDTVHHQDRYPDELELGLDWADALLPASNAGADDTFSHRSFTSGIVNRVRSFVERRIQRRANSEFTSTTESASPRARFERGRHPLWDKSTPPIPAEKIRIIEESDPFSAMSLTTPNPIRPTGDGAEKRPVELNPRAPAFSPAIRDPSSKLFIQSNEGGKSTHSDFTHCGRHGNAWLFHNFSVRDTAKGVWDRRRRAG